MSEIALSPIEDVIEEARNGRMFILVDDEDRENEGDLVIPAQMATPDAINFMARYGRGLICLPLTRDRAEDLNLAPMTDNNEARNQTAFTVSIEAKTGITTGISAADRARTVAVAIDPTKTREDLATPGHVFPLIAQDGGVLVRAGHTEASVDIARLAGLNPSAVICEIMNDDGTMARLPDLVAFAREHGLKVATIRDLIAYRLKHDILVSREAEKEFTRKTGCKWRAIVYTSPADRRETTALVLGQIGPDAPVPVRMHSLNPFEDILGMDHPRTGQLERAMRHIEQEGRGVVVLFPGLVAMRPSYLLNRHSGEKEQGTLREYGIGAQILRDIGVADMILMSKTPSHVVGLDGYGLNIVEHRAIPDSL
ncbi:3,4-dihydroxy-2-butanone-4-phosphate synthase [Eilatimonas milleporae]|uniref:3,4-dihydroxy-2-butanone 4-phosphate synthase n=1 Tax=Eilatimonas milleporae TaxID=911205 RepID=A0A3M0CJ30_9PROT|nr:3,4-dihydroxy-2-butanone-4-phosphate synthase [Eilatimonas milleporae]RMB08885.1 3,4-dihydroxy 2-butanone 4-phosphate synthase/GTP cyclohydrolase II [Eilatimonas milleporae]